MDKNEKKTLIYLLKKKDGLNCYNEYLCDFLSKERATNKVN